MVTKKESPKKGKGAGGGDRSGGAQLKLASGRPSSSAASSGVVARLLDRYRGQVVPELTKQFEYKNKHRVPKLEKIVLNMGIGRESVANSKAMESASADLTLLTGQKPVIRRAKKAIANFKLREGLPVGVSVTLRRDRMWEFLDRLINVALPRVRDFRGLPTNAFDGVGNYSVGLTEQIIFPEINLEKTQLRGMNITFVTSARSDQEGRALLKGLGFPFRN